MSQSRIFLCLAVWVTNFAASPAARGEPATPHLPDGRRLRQIVADKYPTGNVFVGGTTGWHRMTRAPGVILDREFSYVTPENDFKQSHIHPSPGVWKWNTADQWIAHCQKHGQVLRLHAPISPQCSTWAKEDLRTAEELKRNLTEYISALCQRYDRYEVVRWLDVINETVLSDGQWHGPREGARSWECPWAKIGVDESHHLKPPLYIKLAFQIATANAPNTKLIINQHGGMQEAMWAKIKALVPYLRQQGLRVDGIGWQAHIHVGWEKQNDNIKRLGELIDWAHANNLSFHITEQNVWLKGNDKDLEAQAKTFAAIFGKLLEKRGGGVVTWNVWNLSDADAWRQEEKMEGCLFDRQYRAKPAYYALQKLLENPPNPKRP